MEAYFHPQDTIQDVRNWLIDSCFISSPSTFAFDLYVTPPRSVLPLNSTLQELGLVPAALLYVSWNNPPPAHENLVMSLPGSAYLTPDLYHKANSYHFMEAQGESQTAREDSETERQVHHFPQGQKLVKEPEVVKDQFLADPTMSVGESDSKNRVGSKKPRWLKT